MGRIQKIKAEKKNKIVHVETSKELSAHAKRLTFQSLKKWSIATAIGFVVEITILLALLAASTAVAQNIGIVLISLNGLVVLTYLIIFDAVPARKFKKAGFKQNNGNTVNQNKVFFQAMKVRTIIRTTINLLLFGITLLIVLLVYVL